MRYNRSCLDSFKKESTRGFQLSSEEKPSFPHGDLRIAVQKHSRESNSYYVFSFET